MRNRLNKLGLESKSHYKLYKSGRRWVAASITVFSVGIGLTFSQVEQVKAATGTGLTRPTIALALVPTWQNRAMPSY